MKNEKKEQDIVRYLSPEEKERSRALYEEMFPEDEKSFVDAYYRIKAPCGKILVLERESELLAMLHLNPYRFRLLDGEADSNYIVAVATRPQYRHRGCMSRLLGRALADQYEQEIPFTFLMPAREEIYTPFGFRMMKNDDAEKWSDASELQLRRNFDLFVIRDEKYWKEHITGYAWEETPMMVRIVHLRNLAERFRATEPVEIILCVHDELLPENDGCFIWRLHSEGGSFVRRESNAQSAALRAAEFPAAEQPEAEVSAAELGRFLFGAAPAEQVFSEARPEVLEKLKKIRTIRRSWLNETV